MPEVIMKFMLAPLVAVLFAAVPSLNAQNATQTGVQQSALPAALPGTPVVCGAGMYTNGVDSYGNANTSNCSTPPVGITWAENDLAFSATPAFSSVNYTLNYLQLTGNVTSSTLPAPAGSGGNVMALVLAQDATGLHTFAWPSNVRGTFPIGLTGGKLTLAILVYVKAITSWVVTGSSINL